MLVGAELRRPVARRVSMLARVATFGLIATALVVGVPASSASAVGFTCGSGPSYTVRSGDGWFAIADRVDVSARSLLEANGAATSDLLVPGDRLCLPGGADLAAACGNAYTVRSGDGWFAIASRAGVSTRAVLSANAADLGRVLHPGDVICLPDGAQSVGSSASGSAGAGSTYTVARGDSWFGIAQRADVSTRSLLAVNEASSGDVIVPGQQIRLPAGARQPTTSSSQAQWVDLDAAPTQGPCGYGDTWGHFREGGRRHKGTDIFTSSGAYVYAVADGRLTGRNWAQPGQVSGNSWTLTRADGTFFFYAHLSDFNPALRVGSSVRAGEIIGWVGATGNASAAHLHFEIHPGGGDAINPYPVLRAEGGCNDGTPYTQPGGWVPD